MLFLEMLSANVSTEQFLAAVSPGRHGVHSGLLHLQTGVHVVWTHGGEQQAKTHRETHSAQKQAPLPMPISTSCSSPLPFIQCCEMC